MTSMTPTHKDLTRLGFANLTGNGKTAGLRWIEGGVGLYCGLKVEAGRATWEHAREFRGDAGLDEAKAALVLWKTLQQQAQLTDCV